MHSVNWINLACTGVIFAGAGIFLIWLLRKAQAQKIQQLCQENEELNRAILELNPDWAYRSKIKDLAAIATEKMEL